MIKRALLIICVACLLASSARAATLATFKTSVGSMELEFYDDIAPVTVSNFIKYAQSGRYEGTFLHRWVPNFIIQGGGFIVTNTSSGTTIQPVATDPPIRNEYRSDYKNVYGAIAMARTTDLNSASSQWFLDVNNNEPGNLGPNYAVFGHVTAGTNVLNLFVPPPPTVGIYNYAWDAGVFTNLPTLRLPTNRNDLRFSDLIFVDISLRRDLGLSISRGRSGKTLAWNTVAGVSNIVEFATNLVTPHWQTLTNVPGTGNSALLTDPASDPERIYRVKLLY